MINACSKSSSIDISNVSLREKIEIAEVSASTLCRLNSIMRKMKNSQENRANLKCNIWRLKTALRIAGKETFDTLHTDPLFEHQRNEIKRLQSINEGLQKEISEIKSSFMETQDKTKSIWKFDEIFKVREFLAEREHLNNEIIYLKSRLRDFEGDHEHNSILEHLRCKLKEFMIGDQTVEIIFADTISKVVETVANLSEELVNTSEHLQKSKIQNEELSLELDRLSAMLRSKNGDVGDHRRRINELDSITKSLKEEINIFKDHSKDDTWKNCSLFSNSLKSIECLAEELKQKLKNDREALLIAGDQDCLKYITNIIDLRVNLNYLCVELKNSNADDGLQTCKENGRFNKGFKRLAVLENILKEIDDELEKLKEENVMRHCRISGMESSKYLKKIEELEITIDSVRTTVRTLNDRSVRNLNESAIEELENLIRKVCREMKELEVIVESNNRSCLAKRIEELEESIVRSKIELSERKERIDILLEKFSSAKTELEGKTMELKDARNKIIVLTQENKSLKERARRTEVKMAEASRERETWKKQAQELQQVKYDTSVMKKKLRDLEVSKELEAERTRVVLRQREEEIKMIEKEKKTAEVVLNAEIANLKLRLETSLEENKKLREKIEDSLNSNDKETPKRRINPEEGDAKYMEMLATNEETKQLKIELSSTKEELENVTREIIDLKARSDHFSSDRAKLEANIVHLESKKEVLVYQLAVEKTSVEERMKEIAKIRTEYNESEKRRMDLEQKNEQLEVELMDLRAEKESLQKSMKDIHEEHSVFEDRVNNYKREICTLRIETENLRNITEELKSELSRTRSDSERAKNEARIQKSENSRLADNLDDLTLKNTAIEARVQVLLTEKNDLATRINDLHVENVDLKDQLNKAKTENEYSSIELNKSRIENDKAKSENVRLRNSCEETSKTNRSLITSNEELRGKLAEIQSEYRILDNRLKILQTKTECLRRERESLYRENNALRSSFDGNNPRTEIPMKELTVISEGSWIEKGKSNDVETIERIENNETRRTDGKLGSNDKRKCQEGRGRVKERSKDEVKRLIVENEALKFELTNLRTRNSLARLELSRTKDELERVRCELMGIKTGERMIMPVSNKLEIVNLYYKQEVNSYSTEAETTMDRNWMTKILDWKNDENLYLTDEPVQRSGGTERDRLIGMIDRLKVENVALKMEVNVLRCNVVAYFTEDERRRNELRNAVEEIRELKVELAKVRDERESLNERLDITKTELDKLQSEKVALKDELVSLRKTNSNLQRRGNQLRDDYQKLREVKMEFEGRLISATREMKRYTNLEEHDDFNEQLRILLRGYSATKEFLHDDNEKIDVTKNSMVSCDVQTTFFEK